MPYPDSDHSRQKWNRKYAEAEHVPTRPSAVLQGLQSWLPQSGKAIDVAGGGGRNAIWLAERGLDVTLADISLVGLELARQCATQRDVLIDTQEFDLEQGRFPSGPWDLILVHLFLWRPLFQQAADQLAPNGRLLVIQPTVTNQQRHAKPPAPFLLDDEELPDLIRATGLRILLHRESWDADGRFDAVVVAEQPS